ncbi:MAG: hypothetical protein ACXU9O_13025 [Gemmatimonadaceae bacterium]
MENITLIKRVRTALLSAPFVLTVSCTVYTPVHGVEATPGNDVRLRLTDKGAVDLAPRIGPRARTLEGTLRQVTDSSMVVSVRRVSREDQGEDTYNSLEITIPSQDIETAETSKTSAPRSILAAGAVIATALLAAKGAGDLSGSGGNKPPPGGK